MFYTTRSKQNRILIIITSVLRITFKYNQAKKGKKGLEGLLLRRFIL